jgi:hypothetical protein
MKIYKRLLPFAICVLFCSSLIARGTELKPRLVVLTDIAPANIEPDDMESMVRLMVHADLFEIEAIITTTGYNNSNYPPSWMDSLVTTVNSYEKDLPNLMKRSDQKKFFSVKSENDKQYVGYWPSPDYLRNRMVLGSLKMGIKFIGPDNDSEGSNLIIKLADEEDERPLWITVWGGGNTLAQAVWRVQQDRSAEDFIKFLHKLRVYTITDQDKPWERVQSAFSVSAHQWLRRDFSKDLMFIWDESAWLLHNSLGSSSWQNYSEQIQGHGTLGSVYPKYKWGVEGDTPSFLHILPNGLNDPNDSKQAGWGGYSEFGIGNVNSTYCYTNWTGEAKKISDEYFKYFFPAIFNNFAARMDWAAYGSGNRNPIVIVNGSKGFEAINIETSSSSVVSLDASKSEDPEDNSLKYKWWIQSEAGGLAEGVTIKDFVIENEKSAIAKLVVPKSASKSLIHIICEVSDDGEPSLTSYRRVIVTVK